MIEYKKEFCDDFFTVAEKARQVAIGNNEPVFFEFNQIDIIVYPDSNLKDTLKIYSLQLSLNRCKRLNETQKEKQIENPFDQTY